MKGTKLLAAAACVGALLWSAAAVAQSADDWRFYAIIYGYLPSIGGTTTFPRTGISDSATIDADKILSNLKFAFMGTFDVNKGRWGVTNDVMYVNVGDSKSGTRDISIGGTQIPADASASVDLTSRAGSGRSPARTKSCPIRKLVCSFWPVPACSAPRRTRAGS